MKTQKNISSLKLLARVKQNRIMEYKEKLFKEEEELTEILNELNELEAEADVKEIH